MKATAIAHPNVPIIKYWGKADQTLFLPMNNSISMTVDERYCKVTVEFSEKYRKDEATINSKPAEQKIMDRVLPHLDRIRKMANIKLYARGSVEMNFPIGAGLASSSAGFAALTLAASKAAGLNLGQKELSILTRKGSGSSCRSIYGGWVEWEKGHNDTTSHAVQLVEKNHWDISIITAVVSKKERMVDTRGGMAIAQNTSPLYDARVEYVEKTLPIVRKAIKERDFTTIGQITERDSMLLHATAITSDPILLYWTPETIHLLHQVRLWRQEGLEVYFTIETGANVHVLCLPKDEKEVVKRLKENKSVMEIHVNKPGDGATLVNDHLF